MAGLAVVLHADGHPLNPRGAPIGSHSFISLNNIPNILRDLYGKTPHNKRKCGWQVSLSFFTLMGILWIPSVFTHLDSTFGQYIFAIASAFSGLWYASLASNIRLYKKHVPLVYHVERFNN